MGIASKLAAAAAACAYVQKDGSNQHFRYRFVSAANILGHVNDALAAAGLAVIGTAPEVVSTEGSGKDRIVTVRTAVTVADTTSDERAVFVGMGSGMDTGDKAVMKAQTAALKYAWLGAFSISTGDDPEADPETDKRAAAATQKKPAPAPAKPAAAPVAPSVTLGPFFDALKAATLPGEVAQAWMRHRALLGAAPKDASVAAWKAAHEMVDVLQKTRGGGEVWLKKAIAEEDARRAASRSGETAS